MIGLSYLVLYLFLFDKHSHKIRSTHIYSVTLTFNILAPGDLLFCVASVHILMHRNQFFVTCPSCFYTEIKANHVSSSYRQKITTQYCVILLFRNKCKVVTAMLRKKEDFFMFPDCKEVKPVEQHTELPESFTHSVRFAVPEDEVESLVSTFKLEQNLEVKETNRCASGNSTI